MIQFDNSFARELPEFYARCVPEPSSKPTLVYFNQQLAQELGLDDSSIEPELFAKAYSGNELPAGCDPIAQVYAGHQFGRFNPQLGDGRALILGEILARSGQRLDLCLKGSGQTPFSRGGDGRAALGPMLREVLISENMHALGIPTTRSLAVIATGDTVYRNTTLPGAILVRTGASHIRIGTFEFFAARNQHDKVKKLADYTIARHDPDLIDLPDKYLKLIQRVAERQAKLVAQWMSVGFIHGVMNTDNMTISGETIDFGPCAFMEGYDPDTVFSSIDHYGRYAYKNQPSIAQWNLARFAECLLPLLAQNSDDAVELATSSVNAFGGLYEDEWLAAFRKKLGLKTVEGISDKEDIVLINRWLDMLERQKIDFTQAFNFLDATRVGSNKLNILFNEPEPLRLWLDDWKARQALQHLESPVSPERLENPWIIARNHHVEQALESASNHLDLSSFERLLAAFENLFDYQDTFSDLSFPASKAFTRSYQTFCGT